ncbi:shiftless antiviral inhibitor of ribosomal frameshifting protein homolog isoform X2 [Scyliorhinus canicula]|uniref:shiftless antiviral inhibitor of ribosomal frameshifting protein homolog isoform X2 n=1 Tax=Scyliorhinus canicula TaxID=7830 RepID=UPI0018F4AF0B|nr:shiftless antiviral inhibitor of ribosomal frameshifting protein homolog isoform X2 [Scyliorhinus canicula]
MHQGIQEDEIELEKSTRRLRETFHAKAIPVPKADSLMRRHDNDYKLVTQEILRLKDQADDAEDNGENQLRDDAAEPGEGDDDNDLQVSRCRRCKRRYDPVPRDREWGLAEYVCQMCNHSFRGFGQMGLPAPCYRCRSVVLPIRIIPPKQNPLPLENRRRTPHSCCAEDCYNRQEPYVPGTHCIHPKTRQVRGLPRVLCASETHESTGSTVASCISQGSSMECDVESIIQEDLMAIPEEDED